jgi:hypothetical protein
LHCNDWPEDRTLFLHACSSNNEHARKEKLHMTVIRTKIPDSVSITKNWESAGHAGIPMPLIGSLVRLFVTVSLLAVTGAGLAVADEVTEWNHIMLEATLVATPTFPATPAPVTTRSTAIVQAAIFDAVNGIDPRYTPIFVRHAGPRKAGGMSSKSHCDE